MYRLTYIVNFLFYIDHAGTGRLIIWVSVCIVRDLLKLDPMIPMRHGERCFQEIYAALCIPSYMLAIVDYICFLSIPLVVHHYLCLEQWLHGPLLYLFMWMCVICRNAQLKSKLNCLQEEVCSLQQTRSDNEQEIQVSLYMHIVRCMYSYNTSCCLQSTVWSSHLMCIFIFIDTSRLSWPSDSGWSWWVRC